MAKEGRLRMHIFVTVPFGERFLGQRDRIILHFNFKL